MDKDSKRILDKINGKTVDIRIYLVIAVGFAMLFGNMYWN